LQPEIFSKLRKFFQDGLKEQADLFNLLTSTIINDLGKDPALAEDVSKTTGLPPNAINHDRVIYKAVKADMIPCIRRLGTRPALDVKIDRREYLLEIGDLSIQQIFGDTLAAYFIWRRP